MIKLAPYVIVRFFYNLNIFKDKSSHDRRSSHSRAGVILPPGATKSAKRLSIGSLPQSLAAVEPIQVKII